MQRTDLEWVARHRSRLRTAAGIGVRLTRQVVQKLPARRSREALESVLVGDCVVCHLTKHWQGHDGHCQGCLVEETVDRVFWHCPRCVQQRQGSSRCGEG